ncbi:hypothetical protein [Marinibactrum halimedae]|uniref:Transporter substrate-binding domain-containing protein n=1 Tax=Marinibactrum halimedae TaxID=1444977 RepID=A0AA37WMJ6_9GAMM|nr:hypothetical protein [Marinibactrum halimedae]GLS25266.1 hypothetical protein GCM10007877_09800 [Marinibactrum halimedae]
MAFQQEVDGELSRIFKYDKHYPFLVRVEEPHWDNAFIAITDDPNLKLDGWEALSGTDLRVSCSTGTLACENALSRLLPKHHLRPITRSDQGIKMLLTNRTDILILSHMRALSLFNNRDLLPAHRLYVAGIMEHFTAHAFLHKKYRHLVPLVSTTLRTMKQEGLFKQFQQQADLKIFLHSNYSPHSAINTVLY